MAEVQMLSVKQWIPIIIFSLVITLASSLVGLAFNFLRPNGIPLIKQTSWKDVLGDEGTATCGQSKDMVGEISPEEARRLLGLKDVTFVDARASFAYEESHIPGALNVSLHDTAEHDRLDFAGIPKNGLIIIYCDSNECHDSKLLAQMLEEGGCSHLRILAGGWPAWLTKYFELGFDIETSRF